MTTIRLMNKIIIKSQKKVSNIIEVIHLTQNELSRYFNTIIK